MENAEYLTIRDVRSLLSSLQKPKHFGPHLDLTTVSRSLASKPPGLVWTC